MEFSEADRAKAMAAVKAIFDRYFLIAASVNFNGFDKHAMESAKLVDATPKGTASFEFVITEKYGNVNGVMHGGAAGVLFDMFTTSALGPIARPGYWDFLGGVTRTLNISYLKAIPIGTTILINSTVVQVGRTMAMIRGQMTSPDGSVTFCTCEHHKVAVPTRPEHLKPEFEIEWDRLWKQENQKAKL